MNPDLKKRRLQLKLTLEEVGDLVGVGKSTVRKWETGDIENMKRDKIVKLAKALQVSPAYIMGMEEEVDLPLIPAIPAPVLSQISAGEPLYAEENIIEYAQIPAFLYKENVDQFYLRVSGDSMDKEFKEGDLVLVEKGTTVENGQIGVVFINGYNATVKRIRYDENKIILYPESNNPEHIPQVFSDKDEVTIVGKVISSQKFY